MECHLDIARLAGPAKRALMKSEQRNHDMFPAIRRTLLHPIRLQHRHQRRGLPPGHRPALPSTVVLHCPSHSFQHVGSPPHFFRSPFGQYASLQNRHRFAPLMCEYFRVRKLYTSSACLLAHRVAPMFPGGYQSISSTGPRSFNQSNPVASQWLHWLRRGMSR